MDWTPIPARDHRFRLDRTITAAINHAKPNHTTVITAASIMSWVALDMSRKLRRRYVACQRLVRSDNSSWQSH
jgi:hypothetical protein